MSEARQGGDIGGRVARGALWIAAARAATNLLGFVSMIVVARILTPEDFGIVAVAVTAMQLLQGVSDFGLSQAVVRFRDAGRDDLDTLFTFAALRGVAIALLLAVAAPLAAWGFGDPRLAPVFLGAAIHPLLIGFINPRFFEFERSIDFSKEFVWSVVGKIASVAVAISAAIVLKSYWAIILGLIALAAAQLALSYAMRPYAPRISLASWRKVLGFSGWLGGVAVMAALNNKTDVFILSRVLGAAPAGNFYYGFQLAEMPTREFATPIARAIYPGLSELQAETERMRSAFLKGVEALGAVAMPAAVGFAFVARDFIALFLGVKWQGAAPVVEVLTPVLGAQTLFLASQYYAMSLGLTRIVFVRELIYFLVRFPLILWATIAYGFEAAVLAMAAAGVLHVGLNLFLYASAARRPWWDPLIAARRSLGAVALMGAYFLIARPHIDLGALAAAERLALDVAAGAAVYATALLGLWRLEGMPDGVERKAARLVQEALGRVRRA